MGISFLKSDRLGFKTTLMMIKNMLRIKYVFVRGDLSTKILSVHHPRCPTCHEDTSDLKSILTRPRKHADESVKMKVRMNRKYSSGGNTDCIM